jgi:hypothetical protein
MDKVLVIVDVQKEFSSFIQHDLVDELHNYAENFKEVYQIWDTHKTNVAPTYKFPNQVDSIKKLFGVKHFSDKVKEFTDEIEDESYEGRTFKLANNKGYIVRVDNNHDWFWVNPEIVELISKLKDKKVILTGGADNECLEDVYQAFLAFGLDVEFNKKYVYSAKTDNDDSIEDKQINETKKEYSYDSIIVVFDNIYELKEFNNMYDDADIGVIHQISNNAMEYFNRGESVYFKYYISYGKLNFDGWCNVKYLLEKEPHDYEKLFSFKDVKNGLFNQILTNGFYATKPSYKPKRIERTLESNKQYPFDEIVVVLNNINEIIEFLKMYNHTNTEMPASMGGIINRTIEYFDNGDSIYFRFKIPDNKLTYEGWGNLKWLLTQSNNTYEKLFLFEDVKRGLFNQILTNGFYATKPSYKPKRIERTLENVDNEIYLNEITGKSTKYKFRFKTEDEFRNEFSGGWNGGWSTNRYMWISIMSYLYGKDLQVLKTSFTTDEDDDVRNYDRENHPTGNGFIITGYMVKENKPFTPSYKPKRVVRTLENKVLKLDEYLFESTTKYNNKRNSLLDRIKEHRYFMIYADDKQNTLLIKNLLESNGIKHDTDNNQGIEDIDTRFDELSVSKRLCFTVVVDYNSISYIFETYNSSTISQYYDLFIKVPEELQLLNDIDIIKSASFMYKPKKIIRTLENVDNSISSYLYVVMENKKDAYDFEKLLNDNNYKYFDEEETEDMINVYNTAYDIDDDDYKYFMFFIDFDERDYVLRVKMKNQLKTELFYPKQKGEIMRKLDIIPLYKPKKINREL